MPRGVYIRNAKNMKNVGGWNRGLTKETDKRVAKMSDIFKAIRGLPKKKLENSIRVKALWADPNSIYNSNQYREKLKLACNRKDVREKHSVSMKKKWTNSEYRIRLINAHTGKVFSKETKTKKSIITKKQWQDPEVRVKMSEGIKKHHNKLEYRNLKSKQMIDIWNNSKYKNKVKKSMKLAAKVPERKKKRIQNSKMIFEKRVESSGFPRRYLVPSFNFSTIPIFKTVDDMLSTISRYGGTGAGEKKIGRYFVDCFNKEYKFIVEWNEPAHYTDGELNKYDIDKRKYILEKYPDYHYITIKQDNWFNDKGITEENIVNIAQYIYDEVMKKNKLK